ncbi:MAG TPA: wax ester/triacylglycerol synthase family O-acyltransferase [Mycobacteriales bacterium]|nr:wax ester/triacylglycerol synthase family O-acyltransferase [Mycobacteriales bacterium]
MQQLSGVDASFLHMETGTTFGHVCGVVLLDGRTSSGQPLTAAEVERVVQQRLPLMPPLRRRLVEVPFGLERPYWVNDPDFDLSFHVRELALPRPGGREQLAEQVARIAARPLDRRHPLWELYVISGLEDGGVALLVKVHHAAVDGVAAVELISTLLDRTPDPGAPAPPSDDWRPERLPSPVEMWWRGLAGLSVQPLKALELQGRAMRALPRSLRFHGRSAAPAIGGVARRLTGGGSPDGGLLNRPPVVAPRTPFNRPITAHRRWAYGTTPLPAVKQVKNAFGVTVNDVVMAGCAGGLRRWLQAHDALPDGPLVAMVPVSIRSAEQQGAFGNRVSAMLAALPTHLADPVDRLRAAHEGMRAAKEQHAALDAEVLQDIARFAAPALATRAARVAAQLRLADVVNPPFNLVVSNVPGPREPLYLAGARVRAYLPVSVVADGLGLNITVQSYLDNLDVGLVACRELVPDLWDLLGMVLESFDELATAAHAQA